MRKFTKLELLDFKESNLSFDEWFEIIDTSKLIVDEAVRDICEILDITFITLRSRRRTRYIVDCRIIIGTILVKRFNFGKSEAGRYLKRDHSSIIHYLKEHKKLIKFNKQYKDLYIECLSVIKDE